MLHTGRVFRRIALGRAERSLVTLLRYPLKTGTTWVHEQEADPFGAPGLKTTYRVGREEWVEVPAGRFLAVRLDITHETEGTTTRERQWHAPKMGMVQSIRNVGETEQVDVLQAFKAGAPK